MTNIYFYPAIAIENKHALYFIFSKLVPQHEGIFMQGKPCKFSLSLSKFLILLLLVMTTSVLWGQAGDLSFVPLSDAPNGLRRMAVRWDNYGLSQSITSMQVEVAMSPTDLEHVDHDAMIAQTLPFPGATLDRGASGYTDGGRYLTFRASSFNTSTYPGPRTLFVIYYVGTPDCTSTVDTTVQFTWGTICSYFSGTIYPITKGTNSTDNQSFSCNYIRGSITSPFSDPACEDNYNGGIEGVNVAGYFQSTTTGTLTRPTNVNLDTDETLNDGAYLLDDTPSGVYVKIRPSKSNGLGCGISTSDLNNMRNYILGTEEGIAFFEYPWQLIAGDVNYNDTMTTYDISVASGMMSGNQPTPPAPPVNSWTFIPQTFMIYCQHPMVIFSAIPIVRSCHSRHSAATNRVRIITASNAAT